MGHDRSANCHHSGRFGVQSIAAVKGSIPMYKAYFNLARNPFDLRRIPCFCSRPEGTTKRWRRYITASAGTRDCGGDWRGRHREDPAASLSAATAARKAKTLAMHISLTAGSVPTEFLQYIVSDFGLPASGKNKGELLLDLSRFLVRRGDREN